MQILIPKPYEDYYLECAEEAILSRAHAVLREMSQKKNAKAKSVKEKFAERFNAPILSKGVLAKKWMQRQRDVASDLSFEEGYDINVPTGPHFQSDGIALRDRAGWDELIIGKSVSISSCDEPVHIPGHSANHEPGQRG